MEPTCDPGRRLLLHPGNLLKIFRTKSIIILGCHRCANHAAGESVMRYGSGQAVAMKMRGAAI